MIAARRGITIQELFSINSVKTLMSEQKKIKITQVKSIVDHLKDAKLTIKALGLGRPNYFVVKNDTPQIRGMNQ